MKIIMTMKSLWAWKASPINQELAKDLRKAFEVVMMMMMIDNDRDCGYVDRDYELLLQSTRISVISRNEQKDNKMRHHI